MTDKIQDNSIELKHKDVTDKILNAFFKVVHPQLGYGFLEKVYENAMFIALKEMGLEVQQIISVFCVPIQLQ